MFKKIVKAIAAIKTENASPLRTTSSSTVWSVWLRSLNFFAFVCPF